MGTLQYLFKLVTSSSGSQTGSLLTDASRSHVMLSSDKHRHLRKHNAAQMQDIPSPQKVPRVPLAVSLSPGPAAAI